MTTEAQRAAARENGKKGGLPRGVYLKSECKYGHALEGDNLFYRKNGQRVCKACRKRNSTLGSQRYRARMREKFPRVRRVRPPKTGTKPRVPQEKRDRVIQAYINGDYIREIEQEFSVDKKQIYYYLKKAGVPTGQRRGGPKPAPKAEKPIRKVLPPLCPRWITLSIR